MTTENHPRLTMIAVITLGVSACTAGPPPTPITIYVTADPIASAAAPTPSPDLLSQYNACLTADTPGAERLRAGGYSDIGQPVGDRTSATRYVFCGRLYPAVARPASEVQYMFWQECMAKIFYDVGGRDKKQCDQQFPH
jgi:hypothetical protein